MRSPKRRFIQFLRIELDDLREDIEALMTECRGNLDARKVTEHVCLENLAVFKNEILGIGALSDILDGVDAGRYPDLDAMVAEIEAQFTAVISKYGFFPAVQVFVRRKIDKVISYLAS